MVGSRVGMYNSYFSLYKFLLDFNNTSIHSCVHSHVVQINITSPLHNDVAEITEFTKISITVAESQYNLYNFSHSPFEYFYFLFPCHTDCLSFQISCQVKKIHCLLWAIFCGCSLKVKLERRDF